MREKIIMTQINLHALANFLFEMRQLREEKRSGWQLIGIPNKESVAEHSLRAAQIAFALAVLEGHPDPEKIATMLIFHDIGEARIGDNHKVTARYVGEVREEGAVVDQTGELGSLGEYIHKLWKEVDEHNTPAGIIAKDADYLECAFTAKEYFDQGHTAAEDWFKNAGAALKTESAKELWSQMLTMKAHEWWKGLKKLS